MMKELEILTGMEELLWFSPSAGYANRQRPKCTTMPWNIWPFLVVLWGVCWMFVPPSHQDNNPYEFNFDGEDFTLFGSGKTSTYVFYILAKLTAILHA